MSSDKVTLHVQVPRRVKEAFQAAAVDQDLPMSILLRETLRHAVDYSGIPWLAGVQGIVRSMDREAGVPEAELKARDEAWLVDGLQALSEGVPKEALWKEQLRRRKEREAAGPIQDRPEMVVVDPLAVERESRSTTRPSAKEGVGPRWKK